MNTINKSTDIKLTKIAADALSILLGEIIILVDNQESPDFIKRYFNILDIACCFAGLIPYMPDKNKSFKTQELFEILYEGHHQETGEGAKASCIKLIEYIEDQKNG